MGLFLVDYSSSIKIQGKSWPLTGNENVFSKIIFKILHFVPIFKLIFIF